MKKIGVILLISLFLAAGCTNKLEVEKDEYLTYKSDLQKQEEFDTEEELDFNTFFNIIRENDEKVNYSLKIDNPKVDMYNIKALLIHDFVSEDIFPSVGIFDEPVNLLKDEDYSISLNGTIQTTSDISKTKFKLYLEYETENGLENKIYYEVARG